MKRQRVRVMLAVLAARIAAVVCRAFGSRASALPGRYVLKICPDFLRIISPQARGKTIVVCGTNGKTTTNNLICSALREEGYDTVCNRAGANMLGGIAAAYADQVTLSGQLKCDFVCLEIDEAALPLVFEQVTPDIVVVTNLFRDQLDRYGEIDVARALLEKAFTKAPGAQYVLNADDPVTSVFGEGRKAVYYGLTGNPEMIVCDETRDGHNCPKCERPLDYDCYYYGQLGQYCCPACGYRNPQITFGAANILIENAAWKFDIVREADSNPWKAPGLSWESLSVRSQMIGLYNTYNMLAAASVYAVLGIGRETIRRVLDTQQPEPGRLSRFHIGSQCVYLILSKNPTGFNQSVAAIVNDQRQKDVLLALNDNEQDGEDISWIWDVDFETLNRRDISAYTVTGMRRYDMYLRLKYAGYDEAKLTMAHDINSALSRMLTSDAPVYYVLVNYTALYPMFTALSELAERGSGE